MREKPNLVRPLALAIFTVSQLTGCLDTHYFHNRMAEYRRHAFSKWSADSRGDSEELIRGPLSLTEAIGYAFHHNKRILATRSRREVARGRVLESYSEALPSVEAVGSYIRPDKVDNIILPNGTGTNVTARDNYGVALNVTQPIFRGGATVAEMRAAQMESVLADETVRRVLQETIFDVSRDYYDGVLAQHLLDTQKQAVQSAEALLREAISKRETGVAASYDVLRAEVEVSNFRAAMIEQQNRVRTLKASLLRNMGASQESEIELSGQLTYEPVDLDRSKAVMIALENRAELSEGQLEVGIREERLTIAKSRYFPQIDLFFTEQFSRPEPRAEGRTDRWGDRWLGGVLVELPIFDGLRREGQVLQGKARLQQSLHDLSEIEESILFEVEQAILQLQDNEELVASQRLNLKRAQEARRLVEVGYREGVNRQVEVTDARSALTRAEGLYYQALHAHTISRLSLQRALGILGPRAAGDDTDALSVVPGQLDTLGKAQ